MNLRSHLIVAAALLSTVFAAVACTTPSREPAPAATVTPVTPAAPSSQPAPASRIPPVRAVEPTPSPPTREVRFRVRLPDSTSIERPPYLLILPFNDWAWTEHIPLERQRDGAWTATATLEDGALVRYVYDRWDEREWGDVFKDMREGYGDTVRIENRYLLVTRDLGDVDDTVATWSDERTPAPAGVIRGRVFDAATGAPLMDANVSIGGVHIATAFDGSFRLDGVAAGTQRVTVYRTLGDYAPAQTTAEVPAGGEATVEIPVSAARPVEVRLEVALPDDTPPDAEVRVAGNIYRLGARNGRMANLPSDTDLLVLDRASPGRAAGTLALHEGTYVQYFYTIGGVGTGVERTADGREVYRSFVAGPAPETRRDRIAAWRPPDEVRVTVRVRLPLDTPEYAPVALQAGPQQWLAASAPRERVHYLQGFPGQQFRYSYLLGGDYLGGDGTPGLDDDGVRTVALPERDAEITDVVTRWAFSPEPVAPGAGPLEVTFRVSVPPETPPGAALRLTGDRPAIGDGVVMTPDPRNPWLYEASVSFGHDGPLTFRFDRGEPGTESVEQFEVFTGYGGQVFNAWVTAWRDRPAQPAPRDNEYITGFYTPDFWSPGFMAMSESTFRRIREHNGGWVVVSSVWSYGQIDPLPVVESRPFRAPTVLTQREDIVAQARSAREQGLKVLLAPQFNPEMTPGGTEAVGRARPWPWWEAWLAEAEKLWMWNAAVAREISAEALLLPGPVFHVFQPVSFFEDPADVARLEERLATLIAAVREVYDGAILISGSARGYDFPGLADMVGVTTYDTGHPDLPPDATVREWRAAYDALMTERVDPIYERWGRPVLFYTVHLPPDPNDPDPTGAALQANRLEGFFQALSKRPWIAGSLTWSYAMVDAPLDNDDSLRARLAEAVLAKYYGRFAGGE